MVFLAPDSLLYSLHPNVTRKFFMECFLAKMNRRVMAKAHLGLYMSIALNPQLGKDVWSCLAMKISLGETTDIPLKDLNFPYPLACSLHMSQFQPFFK